MPCWISNEDGGGGGGGGGSRVFMRTSPPDEDRKLRRYKCQQKTERHEVILVVEYVVPTSLARSKSGTEVRGRTETCGRCIHVRVIGDPLGLGALVSIKGHT